MAAAGEPLPEVAPVCGELHADKARARVFFRRHNADGVELHEEIASFCAAIPDGCPCTDSFHMNENGVMLNDVTALIQAEPDTAIQQLLLTRLSATASRKKAKSKRAVLTRKSKGTRYSVATTWGGGGGPAHPRPARRRGGVAAAAGVAEFLARLPVPLPLRRRRLPGVLFVRKGADRHADRHA